MNTIDSLVLGQERLLLLSTLNKLEAFALCVAFLASSTNLKETEACPKGRISLKKHDLREAAFTEVDPVSNMQVKFLLASQYEIEFPDFGSKLGHLPERGLFGRTLTRFL